MFNFTTPHGLLRAAHIIPGFIGLCAFWIPVFAKKGGRVHIFFGWVFVVCAAIVIVSAMASAAWGVIDPVSFSNDDVLSEADMAGVRFLTAFLGALAVYTLNPLWLGVRVVRTRQHPELLRESLTRPLIALQTATGVALAGFGTWWTMHLGWSGPAAVLLGLGAFGIGGAWNHWRFVARPPKFKMSWWYKHMQFMLTTGIAFHTAFLVFGVNRFTRDILPGYWALVPWFLPAAIGVPAITLWVRYYRKRFGDD